MTRPARPNSIGCRASLGQFQAFSGHALGLSIFSTTKTPHLRCSVGLLFLFYHLFYESRLAASPASSASLGFGGSWDVGQSALKSRRGTQGTRFYYSVDLRLVGSIRLGTWLVDVSSE